MEKEIETIGYSKVNALLLSEHMRALYIRLSLPFITCFRSLIVMLWPQRGRRCVGRYSSLVLLSQKTSLFILTIT